MSSRSCPVGIPHGNRHAAKSPVWIIDAARLSRVVERGYRTFMVSNRVGTMLVLGADGDLAERLLLPGLGSLLASSWEPGRAPLLLGAGLSKLSDLRPVEPVQRCAWSGP